MSRKSQVVVRCCLGLLLGFIGSAYAADEIDVQTQIAEAQKLLGEQKFADAIEILDEVVTAEPGQGQAWAMLGRAYLGDGRPEQAIQPYMKASEIPGARRFAVQGLVLAYAALGENDEAWKWFQQARETVMVDLSGMALRPEIESLEDDPRFAELFPDAEVFEDPFVEETRILHDWRGEGRSEEFGWEARNIGDVDGDGANDVVVSAPATAPGGSSAGRVYVYSGKTGELLWVSGADEGDQLGMGIEAAGDVNGDRIPDVIAGAPGAGEAYVYSGRDGETLLKFTAADDDGNFGTNVAGVGDVNDDGHADVAIGAPGGGNEAPGRVYVYSGKDGGLLKRLEGEEAGHGFGSAVAGYTDATGSYLVIGAPNAGQGGRVYVYRDLSAEAAFTIEGDETNRQLGGMFVSVIGDCDDDGVPDVYASDWLNAAKGPMTGRIYVHSGKGGQRLLTLTGEEAGDGFGIGPARAGDVDGDGHDDLVIGAWQHGSAAFSGGKVYVYSGKEGALLTTYTGKVPGETFGFDADGMGDVDGDGSIDFLLTSAWSMINGPRSGRTYIVSGKMGEDNPN